MKKRLESLVIAAATDPSGKPLFSAWRCVGGIPITSTRTEGLDVVGAHAAAHAFTQDLERAAEGLQRYVKVTR